MKKLLFSAALSLGIVASASAVEVNLCSSLSSSGTNNLTSNFGTTDGISSMTAANVQRWLSSATASTLYQTTVSGGSGTVNASYSSGTLGFQNTYAYGGAIVGWSYDLSGADLSSTVSVSLSYSGITVANSNCTNNIIGHVAIVYQTGDTWTIAKSESFTTNYSTTGSTSLSLIDVTLSNSTIYLIVYTDKTESGSGTGYRLSGTLSATANYTAVPEPSAFGLLAGLGALAMVVSRRRRRSRRAA